ncbi:MAG TPA: hypothetical protein VKQ70_09965 [Caulobacteraceae bacterium]|jgi:hypothetical protein|nr:hypothetical protein [Caulobacteraceae bacterium]
MTTVLDRHDIEDALSGVLALTPGGISREEQLRRIRRQPRLKPLIESVERGETVAHAFFSEAPQALTPPTTLHPRQRWSPPAWVATVHGSNRQGAAHQPPLTRWNCLSPLVRKADRLVVTTDDEVPDEKAAARWAAEYQAGVAFVRTRPKQEEAWVEYLLACFPPQAPFRSVEA